jgi:hypothetical protein
MQDRKVAEINSLIVKEVGHHRDLEFPLTQEGSQILKNKGVQNVIRRSFLFPTCSR